MSCIAMDVDNSTSTLAGLHPATGKIILRRLVTERNDVARVLADLPCPRRSSRWRRR